MLRTHLHGVIARYSSGEKLLEAAKHIRGKGYNNVEAYTPYHVDGVVDTLGNKDDRVTWIVFFGGVIGALSRLSLTQWRQDPTAVIRMAHPCSKPS
jgi:hypothetical protein